MKTKLCKLRINVLDTIVTETVISNQTYKEKLNELKNAVAETQSDPERETTYVAEDVSEVKEYKTFIKYLYRATLGTTDIELIKIVCKPGFQIKNIIKRLLYQTIPGRKESNMTALFYHNKTHEYVAIKCCCVIPGEKRINIPHLVIIDGNYDEKTTLDPKEYQLMSTTDLD